MYSLNTLVWVGGRLFVVVMIMNIRPLTYRLEAINGQYGLTITYLQLQENTDETTAG